MSSFKILSSFFNWDVSNKQNTIVIATEQYKINLFVFLNF